MKENNIYLELLERVKTCDTPMHVGSNQWGWCGHFPISFVIVKLWLDNDLLEEVASNKYRLSERGESVLAGRIKASDLIYPARQFTRPTLSEEVEAAATKQPAPEVDITDTLGQDLFTDAGTCRLCKKVSSKFGWISHAKSHQGKGDPVEIIERRGKKVAIIATSGMSRETIAEVVENSEPAAPIIFAKPISEMTADEIIAAAQRSMK